MGIQGRRENALKNVSRACRAIYARLKLIVNLIEITRRAESKIGGRLPLLPTSTRPI